MDLKGLDESPLTGNDSQSAVIISPSASSYHLTPSPEIDPGMAQERAKEYLDELADYLVTGLQGAGSVPSVSGTPSLTSPAHTSMPSPSGQQHLLSRPLQRKLSSLSNCSLSDEEGRTKLVRAARSIGERCVNELIVIHQNPQVRLLSYFVITDILVCIELLLCLDVDESPVGCCEAERVPVPWASDAGEHSPTHSLLVEGRRASTSQIHSSLCGLQTGEISFCF